MYHIKAYSLLNDNLLTSTDSGNIHNPTRLTRIVILTPIRYFKHSACLVCMSFFPSRQIYQTRLGGHTGEGKYMGSSSTSDVLP